MPPSVFTDPTFLTISAIALIAFGALLARNIRRIMLYIRWIFIGSRCYGRVLPLDVLARMTVLDSPRRSIEKDSGDV